jgi:Mg-chelatase subunit ChlD
LAAGPGVVYATRSGARTVGAFDPGTGARVRDIGLPEGRGLWPSDVVVAGGTLYTADLVTARIQGWTRPSAPDVAWQAGLLSGPRRLAAGRDPSGARVLAAAMADGHIELHDLDGGNLVARWQPQLPDGTLVHGADVAIDDQGLLYLADPARRAVHVFGPAAGVPATPDPRPSATPTPSASSCVIEGDQVVSPSELVLGDGAEAEVRLSLHARCPQSAKVIGADIVLVLDRSLSMQGAPIVAARAAAGAFAELLDVRHHRLGLASFADNARLDVPLTDDVASVIVALDTLEPLGQTNITAALERAREGLESGGREEALPVIVLLTDGEHNVGSLDPALVAADARAWGAQIYVVGLGDGIQRSALESLTGTPGQVFLAPSPDELFPIYREILRVVLESLAGNFIITDSLPDGLRYVADSAVPPALEEPGRLRWGRSILPSSGITLSLRVRPTGPGCLPVSRVADAEYTDADGARRRFAFPIPTLCAVMPTATPTAEPTPTPRPIFLPLAMREHCVPRLGGADIVLLIDTSSSMQGEKILRAKEAAHVFIAQLDLERDQAAVVGFNSSTRIASPLTSNRRLLETAVDGLRTESGTRIDTALWTAVGLLAGPNRNTKNRPAVILLSDGAHTGPSGAVLQAAAEARRQGARIYTVALGAGVDATLLAAVADPGRAYVAAQGADLAAIYGELATVIPCP